MGKVSINRTGFTLKCCNVAIQGFRFQWLKIFVPTGFLFKMLNRFPFFIGWNVCTCTGFPLKCLYNVHAQDFHWNVCTCTGLPLKCLYMHRVFVFNGWNVCRCTGFPIEWMQRFLFRASVFKDWKCFYTQGFGLKCLKRS